MNGWLLLDRRWKAKCGQCKKPIRIYQPRFVYKDRFYCWDCSYIKGLISENEYLSCCGVPINGSHATIKEGKIIVWIGDKPPWEPRTNRQERNNRKYSEWRTIVFERDNYTCQRCEQRGGELNAHHIKSFSKHKELRYDIDNGITLCKTCHKKEHTKEAEVNDGKTA
jgi:hypothetical protein